MHLRRRRKRRSHRGERERARMAKELGDLSSRERSAENTGQKKRCEKRKDRDIEQNKEKKEAEDAEREREEGKERRREGKRGRKRGSNKQIQAADVLERKQGSNYIQLDLGSAAQMTTAMPMWGGKIRRHKTETKRPERHP
eukprot:6187868-Pleurochrysis_carterae.AAC.5